ncbi:MAG: hypothetical protein HY606_02660 [Planctomycetes bacterium]|nr:hypothetical protein [Planctomycetota bacterium]
MSEIRPIDFSDLQKKITRSAVNPSVSFKDILNAKLAELQASGGDTAGSDLLTNELKVINYELSTLVKSTGVGEVSYSLLNNALEDISSRLNIIYSNLK